MFSVTDILIVVVVVAVLFGVGSKKMPELFRNMGRATGEFQKGKIEIEREVNEMKKPLTETANAVKDSTTESHKSG